jgi:6-pyruvoyltetrahydropterin/6-carboxytetrahydropterin synthase
MNSEVVDIYDHRHLNREVPEFRDRIPTAENIAISIWERLQGPVHTQLPGALLYRVRVYEMADLFADYYGPEATV